MSKQSFFIPDTSSHKCAVVLSWKRVFLEIQEKTSYRPTTQVLPPISSIKIFNKGIISAKCEEKSLGSSSSDPAGLGRISTSNLRSESRFLTIRSSVILLPPKFRQRVYKFYNLHHSFQYFTASFYFYFYHSYNSMTAVYHIALALMSNTVM